MAVQCVHRMELQPKDTERGVKIYNLRHNQALTKVSVPLCVCVHLTSVISREAAAALMCKLGCLTELLQSNARAKVPTALKKHTYRIYSYINTQYDLCTSSLLHCHTSLSVGLTVFNNWLFFCKNQTHSS